MGPTVPKAAKPIVDFVVQVVFGTIGFLVVFGAATIIAVFVRLLDAYIPPWLHLAADWAEKALVAVDLFCFGLFILTETFKLIRGLWSEWSNP